MDRRAWLGAGAGITGLGAVGALGAAATLGALGALGGLVGCSSTPPRASPAVAAGFAPSGTLRASINLGNVILAQRAAQGQPVRGVSVDLATALVHYLNLPLELQVVDSALQSVTRVKQGVADIGFFATDPLRSDGIAFSAPYVLIEGAYLVRQGSTLRDNAQVDAPGQRIMVGKGSAYDLYLSRQLKAAQLMHTTTSQNVVPAMLSEGADVAAGVRQQLEADVARASGLRMLPGRFMVIEQAMGVQAGRGAAVEAALRSFVERAKAEGLVAAALARHGIQGASVAPLSG